MSFGRGLAHFQHSAGKLTTGTRGSDDLRGTAHSRSGTLWTTFLRSSVENTTFEIQIPGSRKVHRGLNMRPLKAGLEFTYR